MPRTRRPSSVFGEGLRKVGKVCTCLRCKQQTRPVTWPSGSATPVNYRAAGRKGAHTRQPVSMCSPLVVRYFFFPHPLLDRVTLRDVRHQRETSEIVKHEESCQHRSPPPKSPHLARQVLQERFFSATPGVADPCTGVCADTMRSGTGRQLAGATSPKDPETSKACGECRSELA